MDSNPATRGPGGGGTPLGASSGTIYAGAEAMAKPDYLFKSLVIGDSGVSPGRPPVPPTNCSSVAQPPRVYKCCGAGRQVVSAAAICPGQIRGKLSLNGWSGLLQSHHQHLWPAGATPGERTPPTRGLLCIRVGGFWCCA